jgi:hypothetical protein
MPEVSDNEIRYVNTHIEVLTAEIMEEKKKNVLLQTQLKLASQDIQYLQNQIKQLTPAQPPEKDKDTVIVLDTEQPNGTKSEEVRDPIEVANNN